MESKQTYSDYVKNDNLKKLINRLSDTGKSYLLAPDEIEMILQALKRPIPESNQGAEEIKGKIESILNKHYDTSTQDSWDFNVDAATEELLTFFAATRNQAPQGSCDAMGHFGGNPLPKGICPKCGKNWDLSTPDAGPSSPNAVEEIARKALEEISKLYHADRSCSLPAQGYNQQETEQIGVDDHAAQIAREALSYLKNDTNKAYSRGAGMIAQERWEQIHKHEWDLSIEEDYGHGELLQAALFCIDPVRFAWPLSWHPDWKERILIKSREDQLKVAGAFMASEIDRLSSLPTIEGQSSPIDAVKLGKKWIKTVEAVLSAFMEPAKNVDEPGYEDRKWHPWLHKNETSALDNLFELLESLPPSDAVGFGEWIRTRYTAEWNHGERKSVWVSVNPSDQTKYTTEQLYQQFLTSKK